MEAPVPTSWSSRSPPGTSRSARQARHRRKLVMQGVDPLPQPAETQMRTRWKQAPGQVQTMERPHATPTHETPARAPRPALLQGLLGSAPSGHAPGHAQTLPHHRGHAHALARGPVLQPEEKHKWAPITLVILAITGGAGLHHHRW